MVATSPANFIPISYATSRDERSRKYFTNLMHTPHNHGRVVRGENGAVFVHPDYEAPLRLEIERLYFEAEALAGNTHKLAVYLARYLTKTETHALYQYFQYFSFKHFEKAKLVKNLLERFIKEHSLFAHEIIK
jgi:hypothetical protein